MSIFNLCCSLYWGFYVKHPESEVKVLVAQSCTTLYNPLDCSLPGSSVLGIFQARILEGVVIAFSRGSSWPRDWTQVFHIAGRFFTIWATREALKHLEDKQNISPVPGFSSLFSPSGKPYSSSFIWWILSILQFMSVTQSYPTVCDPMNCSTPGFPVHHQFLELTQTHVHRVGDAIQPSHTLLSPSPAFSLFQHQGLFQWVSSSY